MKTSPLEFDALKEVLFGVLTHRSRQAKDYGAALLAADWLVTFDIKSERLAHIRTVYDVVPKRYLDKRLEPDVFADRFKDEYETRLSEVQPRAIPKPSKTKRAVYCHWSLPDIYVYLETHSAAAVPCMDYHRAFVFGGETLRLLPLLLAADKRFANLFSPNPDAGHVSSEILNSGGADALYPHSYAYDRMEGFLARGECRYGGRDGGHYFVQTNVFGPWQIERLKAQGFELPAVVVNIESHVRML